jgi:hypothetical protein
MRKGAIRQRRTERKDWTDGVGLGGGGVHGGNIHGSGETEPGRHLVLQAEWTF